MIAGFYEIGVPPDYVKFYPPASDFPFLSVISKSDCDGLVVSLNEFNFAWLEGNPVSHLFVIAS